MKAAPLSPRLMKQCKLRSLNRMEVNARAHSAMPAGTYNTVDSSARCDVCAACEPSSDQCIYHAYLHAGPTRFSFASMCAGKFLLIETVSN